VALGGFFGCSAGGERQGRSEEGESEGRGAAQEINSLSDLEIRESRTDKCHVSLPFSIIVRLQVVCEFAFLYPRLPSSSM
jgi:hypothetical protein